MKCLELSVRRRICGYCEITFLCLEYIDGDKVLRRIFESKTGNNSIVEEIHNVKLQNLFSSCV